MHNQAYIIRCAEQKWKYGGCTVEGGYTQRLYVDDWKPARSQMLLMGRLFLHAVNFFSFPLYVHHRVGLRMCFPFSQAKETTCCI